MKLTTVYECLSHFEPPYFSTTDAAAAIGVSPAHASKILTRLACQKLTQRLIQGKWCLNTMSDPLRIAPFLIAPAPSYLSLQTALFHHGMISQIPTVIYSITVARPSRYTTTLGAFSFHHVEPHFFFGFETLSKHGVALATPEKALLDLFYLAPARSRLFTALPEIELPRGFRVKEFLKMTKKIVSPSRQTLVVKRFEKL